MPIVVRAKNFIPEVLQAKEPVLVDFYGERCMPCQMQRPILLELSQEYEGLKFCMFNTDREARESDEEYEGKFEILAAFNVMNLPTMLLFHQGQLASTLIGLHTKEELLDIFAGLNLTLQPVISNQPGPEQGEEGGNNQQDKE